MHWQTTQQQNQRGPWRLKTAPVHQPQELRVPGARLAGLAQQVAVAVVGAAAQW